MNISTTTDRRARRRRRGRNNIARRLEILEDRTLLNASIDIDADGLLTYRTDDATAETLNVSVSGNVYTFASDVNIDVLSNALELVVTGDGTSTVTVEDIAGLVVDLNFDSDLIFLFSSNVDTTINFNASFTIARLGNPADAAGLGALSAPITVTGSEPGRETRRGLLVVNDYGSSLDTTYTLTPTTLTATNGFGGLTYLDLSILGLLSSRASNEYIVKGTADGMLTNLTVTNPGSFSNTFVVEDTSSEPNSSLELYGNVSGGGSNAFKIEGASSSVRIVPGTGASTVSLGNSEGVAGINGPVRVVNSHGGSVDIAVDNLAGSDSGAWNLLGGPTATLTGFGRNGSLSYTPRQVDSLTLGGVEGVASSLTVDFGDNNPLPSATGQGRLSYNGGGGDPSGASPGLVLMNGRFDNETYDALSPSSGRIILEARGLSSTISLAGLDARGVYNLIEATNYTFNNLSDSSIPVVIKRGEYPLSSNSSLQTLLVSAPGAFVDVHVAMKRYITINANPSALGDPLSVVVDYQHAFPTVPAPVPLYSLTIVTGDDDATVNLLSKPRGGVTRLQQGDGDDQATVSIPELNHTGLLVLDGGGGDNELIIDADGTPMSPAQFESGSSGVTVVNVSAEAGRFLYSNYQRVRVINARMVPPTTTISQIEAVRGRRLDDVTVGSFVNHSRLATPDAFTATIDWGDGVLSAGTIVRDFWNAGRFYITGSHTYHDSPSLSKVTITLVAFGGAFTEVINGVPVAFDLPTLTTTIESPVKVVTEAPVEVSVNSFTDVESAAPVPENFVLATFTQPGGVNSVDPESVGRFAIQVNWGDGSTVMLVRDWPTYDEATETFTVTAPRHTYRTPGTYNVTVIVSWRRADGWPGTVLGSGTGVAHIVDAPLSADSPQPAIPDVVEGSAVVNQVVGSFTDANPLGFAQEFTAMIDWGDGSPLSPGKVIRPGRGGTPFFVVASHLYDTAQPATSQPAGQTPVAGPVTVDGTYPIRIHIHSLYGSSIELSNTITVRDREMVVTGQLDPASGSGAITNLRRPSFFGLASEAAATVFLYATPVGGSPLLIGQATAAAPNGAWSITSNIPLADGSYAIQAQAYDWSGHSVSALTTITPELVVHRPLILTGQLDPASDSGVSNSDAVTNVVQPNFFGLASEAGATVSLYATPWGGSPILIGQATAAWNGVWSITANVALADGGYVIQAQAHNAWGDSTSALTTIAPNLVIDTVGPRINDARIAYFNGRALVVFEDFGGPSNAGTGLDQSTLMDPNNYQFSIFRPRMRGPRIAPRWLATPIQVQPGTSFGGQRATVQINNGRPIPPERFLLGVSPAAPENPSGVRDVAGNALEGPVEWRLAPANRVPIRPAQPPRRPGGPMALRLATMRGIAGG